MRALSLFSGIGGFDIAAEKVGWTVVGMVEWDSFCRTILKKHWPDVLILNNIKDVKGDEFGAIDIIYGGPPCQPASTAGKRGGTNDDRWLWPEAIRLVDRLKPRYFVFENPPGILSVQGGVPFGQVLSELESKGYEIGSFIIPACGVNATHRRDRVWLIGKRIDRDSTGDRRPGGGKGTKTKEGLQQESGVAGELAVRPQGQGGDVTDTGCQLREQEGPASGDSNASDSASHGICGEGRIQGLGEVESKVGEGTSTSPIPDCSTTPNPQIPRLEGGKPEGASSSDGRDSEHPFGYGWDNEDQPDWNSDWKPVAIETCARVPPVDDGLQKRVALLADGSKISEAAVRRESLKACGNAVVPQVVEKIFEAINYLDIA